MSFFPADTKYCTPYTHTCLKKQLYQCFNYPIYLYLLLLFRVSYYYNRRRYYFIPPRFKGERMEYLSTKLTDYILKKGMIHQNNYKIYQYGFQIFLELFFNILCSAIIAVFLHMEIECLLFFAVFIPLRSYNGGFHMNSYLSCLLLSCITLASVLLITKYFTAPPLLSYLLYTASVLLIVTLGPVNHPDRDVDSVEDTQFKKRTKRTLVFSFISSIIFLLSGKHSYLFLESLVFTLVSTTLLLGRIKYS